MNPIFIITGIIALIGLTAARKLHTMNARDIIKKHEGWKANVYTDAAGHPTIGWGHKLLPGETLRTVTQEQGEALLSADMTRIEREIMPAITKPITANQKAAVICFAFNVGGAAFKSSTMLKKINAGDSQGAALEFLKWNKARDKKTGQLIPLRGLTARRTEEKTLFLTA